MNVRQLREALACVPDDTLVVIPGEDHSYRRVNVADAAEAVAAYTAPFRAGLFYHLSEYSEGRELERLERKVLVFVIQ
jgi:hypothetical protein